MTVTCNLCAKFKPNTQSFDQNAIGECGAMVEYYGAIEALGRKPRPSELKKIDIATGNYDGSKLCRPFIRRNCSKFIPIT
jgi:hypothetical protein